LPVNKYGLARIPEIRASVVIYTFDKALLNTTLATDAILCKKDHILELPLSCLLATPCYMKVCQRGLGGGKGIKPDSLAVSGRQLKPSIAASKCSDRSVKTNQTE
jgi:hypothetical protein